MKQPSAGARRCGSMLATLPTLCALIVLSSQTNALAEAVYRCGPALDHYSSTPCEQGRAIDVSDARSAEQRRQGHEAARHHQQAERDLSRDLQAQERRPISAVSFSARSAPARELEPHKPATKKARKKSPRSSTATDTFAALDPNSVPAKRQTKSAR